MSIPAQTKYIVLTILFVLASINFTRTALEILENSKRLDTLSQEVVGLEEEKAALEESVEYKKTDAYIEEKARNDLNLIKPGEKVYVIPKELSEAAESNEVLGEKTKTVSFGIALEDNDSNITKWLNLFLH